MSSSKHHRSSIPSDTKHSKANFTGCHSGAIAGAVLLYILSMVYVFVYCKFWLINHYINRFIIISKCHYTAIKKKNLFDAVTYFEHELLIGCDI